MLIWQIRLWETDLNRVEMTPAYYYDEFPSRVTFILSYIGVLLFLFSSMLCEFFFSFLVFARISLMVLLTMHEAIVLCYGRLRMIRKRCVWWSGPKTTFTCENIFPVKSSRPLVLNLDKSTWPIPGRPCATESAGSRTWSCYWRAFSL